MQIEFIGPTSAGKTTLAMRMVEVGNALGVDTILSDDFILKKLRLNWIGNEFVRRRVVEFAALLVCVSLWRKHRKYNKFVTRTSLQSPGSWYYKLNVARITLKKIGIYEIVRRLSSDHKVVLVDNEGILQSVHNLFVHGNTQRIENQLAAFSVLAPLPDAIIYIQQPKSVLIARTLSRGHPRLSNPSYDQIERFISQAEVTFENLVQIPSIKSKLLTIEKDRRIHMARKLKKNPALATASKLIHESVPATNGTATSSLPALKSSSKTSQLARRLIQSLNRKEILYCHWKGNYALARALAGKDDLDLLVERSSLARVVSILLSLGFKPTRESRRQRNPAATHYYGFDSGSKAFVHVHLYSNVLTGENFIDTHLLPFEKMLLERRYSIDKVRVPSKPAELVLFVLKMFIRYGSLWDLIAIASKTKEIASEWEWLQPAKNLPAAIRLLKRYCPVIDESLFRKCVHTLDNNGSRKQKMVLAFQVRRKLRIYATHSPLQRYIAYAWILRDKGRRMLSRAKKKKNLSSGGAVIAFVGADATGKSTFVSETERWLGEVFSARKVHVGKPPSALLTVPFNLILRLTRRLLRLLHRNKLRADSHANGSAPVKANRPPSLFRAIRALALAWDRYRLLRKVARARAHGQLIICDRYPSELSGAMDSPRLQEQPQRDSSKFSLLNWLARQERELYNRMPPPDIAIKLNVSLRTAKKRNQARAHADRDSDEFLELRHRNARKWQRTGTRHFCEINTEPPLAETILRVKNAIWEAL